MDRNIVLQKANKYRNNARLLVKNDLTAFVRQEFLRLLEKNLKLPIKLFHL